MKPPPDPVRWHSDLLVTPTSLQQLSLRSEALVQALPGRYHPYFWGVSHVEYELDDLKSGVLTVRALDAVMPNGLHVSLGDGAPLRLTLDPGDRKRMLVYLAMRQDDSGESRPFVPCGREAAEAPVGEDGVEIPFVRTRLDLYTDQTPPAPADSGFPLCEVRRDGTSFQITDFMPPTISVALDSPLGRLCAAIPRQLRVEAGAVTDRAQLNALVSALPAFEVVAASRPHPLALYIELCRLAGAVAVLRNHSQPPQFPPYAHDAARPVFDKVVRFVTGAATTRSSTPSGATPSIARHLVPTADRPGMDRRARHRRFAPADDPHDGNRREATMPAQRWGTTASSARRAPSRRSWRAGSRDAPAPRVAGIRAALAPRRACSGSRPMRAARPGEDLLVLADLPAVKDLPGVEDVPGVSPTALHLYVVEPRQREPADG
jgi:hypothetical protein